MTICFTWRRRCWWGKITRTIPCGKRKLNLNWFWKSLVVVCPLFQDILLRPYEMLCEWIAIASNLFSMQVAATAAAAAQSQIQTMSSDIKRNNKWNARFVRLEMDECIFVVENYERGRNGGSERRKLCKKWEKSNICFGIGWPIDCLFRALRLVFNSIGIPNERMGILKKKITLVFFNFGSVWFDSH